MRCIRLTPPNPPNPRQVVRSSELSVIQNHLRAPKQRDRFACFAMCHCCIPHLRCAPHVYGIRAAFNRTFARRAQVIRFEFDGREVRGAIRKVGQTTIAAARIGQCHHGAGVQESVCRHDRFPNRQLGLRFTGADVRNPDAKQAWEHVGASAVEVVGSHGGYGHVWTCVSSGGGRG